MLSFFDAREIRETIATASLASVIVGAGGFDHFQSRNLLESVCITVATFDLLSLAEDISAESDCPL